MDEKHLVPEKEVLQALAISRQTFYNLRKSGKVETYKINGRSYRYNLTQIINALREEKGELCK